MQNRRKRWSSEMTSTSSPTDSGSIAGPDGTQAIVRSLAVLRCFADGTPELGISEISKRLSLSPSTAHRIVRALAKGGLLEQNQATERYFLGRTTMLLGQVAQHNFGFDQAQPILERLRDETGESVNLGIRDGHEATVVLRVPSEQPLRFEQPPGHRVPLHCSAMGKALLAFSINPEAEVSSLGRLKANTVNTITSKKGLLDELRRVRQKGYSLDNEEGVLGAACIGAPIINQEGFASAAVAVQGPAARLPLKRRQSLAPLLIETGQKIANLMPPERARIQTNDRR